VVVQVVVQELEQVPGLMVMLVLLESMLELLLLVSMVELVLLVPMAELVLMEPGSKFLVPIEQGLEPVVLESWPKLDSFSHHLGGQHFH
jgi:hypothetical protein